MRPVVIADYGGGNVRSLRAALESVGALVTVAADPTVVAAASHVLLAGQGAAGTTMRALRSNGLDVAITSAVAGGGRLLGVCVGMQVLFEHSEEDDAECLGLLTGSVRRLDARRLPHMGWNDVSRTGSSHALAGDLPAVAYFAHSFAVPEADDAMARTDLEGEVFVSAAGGPGIVGVQFHPERSGPPGRALLAGFVAWADAA